MDEGEALGGSGQAERLSERSGGGGEGAERLTEGERLQREPLEAVEGRGCRGERDGWRWRKEGGVGGDRGCLQRRGGRRRRAGAGCWTEVLSADEQPLLALMSGEPRRGGGGGGGCGSGGLEQCCRWSLL